MEELLGMRLGEFFFKLLSEPITLLKTLITFWWIKFQNRKKRLHIYDLEDLETSKRGPVLLPIEKKLEEAAPYPDEKTVDSVLIYGENSSGACLIARVCREREGHVSWFYLRLSDGRSYLPAYPGKCYPPTEDYVAGGLRIKCLIAMRKWRVSFNGLLRETKKGGSENAIVHVKFSFICHLNAIPLDLSSDLHPSILTNYLIQENSASTTQTFKTFTECTDRYVQAINLIGTLSVQGEEESEVFLWGIKHKTKDVKRSEDSGSSSLLEVLAFTRDGQVFYAGEYALPGSKSKLTFGLHLERSALSWPVYSCQVNLKKNQPTFSGLKVSLRSKRSSVEANVGAPNASFQWNCGMSSGYETQAYLSPLNTNDGDPGFALVLNNTWTTTVEQLDRPLWKLPAPVQRVKDSPKFVLSLEELACQTSSLTGGKGASLAALTYLAKNHHTGFIVPSGFVVTTVAYAEFFKKSGVKSAIADLEKSAWKIDVERLKENCRKIEDFVSKVQLPASVQDPIRLQFEKQFPDGIHNRRFAVRSSASGEDSEEMSAAGQMSTFLGLIGLENVYEAVAKCWASQFSFTAIQYKRQNGQELNSMMAVVVQEMVPADFAGVLFTCDPVTGNPQNVTITANFGIGESVVGATAEPDTVVLERDEKNKAVIKSVHVGKKSTRIVMADEGNVVELHTDGESKDVCSISSERSMQLSQISLKIEEAYGFPVDVEWAFRENQLYMLQARPVTTFDKETKFEIFHSADDGIRTEGEYTTKANIGEVLAGALSHLGISYIFQHYKMIMQSIFSKRNPYSFPFTPFTSMFSVSHNHGLFNILGFPLRFHKNSHKSFLSESSIIAGFGRLLDDQDLFDFSDRRNRSYPGTFVPYQAFMLFKDMLYDNRWVEEAKKFRHEDLHLDKCLTSEEMFHQIWKRCNETIYASSTHTKCTINSSLCNNIIMFILSSAAKGWKTSVFSDFGLVLSSCGNVESADIPFSMQNLCKAIKDSTDGEKFRQMEPQEALKWLESTNSPAGLQFKEFIQKHGHRCFKEFDVYSLPWRMNKIPLIRALQEGFNRPGVVQEKKIIPTGELIQSFKTPLSWIHKLLLRVVIPMARGGVINREIGKSNMIRHVDFARRGYWTLAEQMTKEGRLPDKELLFFLTTYEVIQLIETRNPSLVQKAVRRRAIFPELDKLRFPEIMTGIPTPTNLGKRITYDDLKSDLEIKGTPVSQGVVKARARVATSIDDACLIKQGEILIAYCTDIAWSPYFPLLAGVATELGGLISHGAVVAREYGLPCVVGVFDATFKFKTGDLVLLDGNKGILKRLEQAQEN